MYEPNFFNPGVPPRIEDVKIYFSQKGMPEPEAETFFLYYEKKNWTSKRGNFFTNWKKVAFNWIAGVIKDQPLLFQKGIH